MKNKTILYFLFTIFVLLLIEIFDFEALIISFYILCTYMIYKPDNLFHPNNIVFAFSFLYIFIPSSIYYWYEFYNIQYVLPWGKTYEWDKLSKQTHFYMIFIFIVPYFSFYYFTKNMKSMTPSTSELNLNKKYLLLLLLLLFVLVAMYVSFTGGINSWLFNYQYTYLVKREGNGLLNVLILLFGNIVVFLLGIIISQMKFNYKKILYIVFSMALIILVSYLQGFKSRFIILMLLFLFPMLIKIKLTYKNIITIGFLFMLVLVLGNYLRSDGFYDTSSKALEYMITYFNVYPLHEMATKDFELDLFQTIHHFFVKPLVIIGFLPSESDFDLSVMMTKFYFPDQWYDWKATQQWPLATELHLNYYGMLFGWIPIIIYTFIISVLYKKMLQNKVEFTLIYLIEMIRIFATFRGVFLPWMLPLDLILYLFTYILFKKFIINKKSTQ